MKPSLPRLRDQLHKNADPEKARIYQRFFKTGPGEYGEGDCFIGVLVPQIRKLVKIAVSLPLVQCKKLIISPIHEERMLGVLILVAKFKQSPEPVQKEIFILYTTLFNYINNWDLVDSSAEHITGSFLFHRDQHPLFRWAKSAHLWTRRIAIMSTFHYIKHFEFETTLQLADQLLKDSHDLIHKSVGWMLREIGNRNLMIEENFLKSRYKTMPRTMLRYAIEKFPKRRRKQYLLGDI
ncbi:DNA alkylation repair protein [bacterium]|nr:DNA alkylation repair protein [bacterium]